MTLGVLAPRTEPDGRLGVLRGFLRVLGFILSGLLRGLAVLYWTCFFRRRPGPDVVRSIFAGWSPANLIPRRAEMPHSHVTAVAEATRQKAPRNTVSGILESVADNALTVNGQPYARGKVFQGTWPAAGDVGRACELMLVQARSGSFVIGVTLAAKAAPVAAEPPAEAPKARKPISPKQAKILAERATECRLEGAVAEISRLRFGKKPEELSTWEAGFMIDFFGRYPASLHQKKSDKQ